MARVTKIICSAEGKRGQFSNQNGLSLMVTIEPDLDEDPMLLMDGWNAVLRDYIDDTLDVWHPPIEPTSTPRNGGGRY